ncbi:hypothetical protein [Brevundimonas sp.]|uniref:hypothetical protein n=1 Tax=Brevundimonas sp. TaxID=1871086 RepID=UPI00272F84E5|nr:hypothetical protein [Brevundimonas sp.]MDP1914405.1 hypothetical protein [Brevundimonas sp.]
MIKALSLAAALALLPMSAAVADEARGPSEDAIEAAAEAFEARMEAFGERAEAISVDASLTEAQREVRIAALWAEYQPDVTAFTSVVSEHASAIAAEALAGIDIEAVVAEALAGIDSEAVVAEALAEVEASGALAGARDMAANGAWASNDPEHMATYGLMAEYALGEAMDSLDDIPGEIEAAVEEANEAAAESAQAPNEVETPDED